MSAAFPAVNRQSRDWHPRARLLWSPASVRGTAGRVTIEIVLQQLINGLMLGAIYVLVAVAFTLTIGVLNFLNFSIPGIFMVGGVSSWAVLAGGAHWTAAIAAGLAFATVASLVVERFTYRWLRNAPPVIPLVSSLGFLILFEHLVVIRYGSNLQSFPTPFPDANMRFAGLVVGIPQLASLLIAIALVAGLNAMLRRTRAGRGLRSIAENPDTALLLGVDVNRIVPLVFLISGLFTGLAGILFAFNYVQVSPFMGEQVALKGISAMVIGGMGNVWGAIAGGLIIGLIEVLSIYAFGARTVDIVVYGALLVLLCVKPTGLFGDTGLGKEKM